MVQAQGYFCAGTDTATNNLRTQVPAIVAGGFPEIGDYHPGTLNVRSEQKIVVAGSDHRTAPIIWAADQTVGEVFDLVRVRLRFSEIDVEVRGLMYIAYWSPHRISPHNHEFLAARFIPGLRIGAPVTMQCDRPDSIRLPYLCSADSNGQRYLAETIVIL